MRSSRFLALVAVAAIVVPSCRKNSSDGGSPTSLISGLLCSLRGGDGATGNGGGSGVLNISAATGADILMLRAGAVNATATGSFAQPALGANPRTIAADTTLTPPFNGDVTPTPATGLWIRAGFTLTLDAGADLAVPAGNDTAVLALTNGLFIEGTLKLGFRDGTTINSAHFTLTVQSVRIATSGRLDLAGVDDTVAPGGTGGNLSITAAGSIVNQGSIDATGGDGTTAANGGAIGLNGNKTVFNAGTIESSGGAATSGVAGNAGGIGLAAANGLSGGGAHNNGTIRARGGSSTGGANAGQGSAVTLVTSTEGGVTSSGTIDTTGGTTDSGTAGTGGAINFNATNGIVRVTGTLSAPGGTGTTGGSGGSLFAQTSFNAATSSLISSTVGGVEIAASINLAGGAGTTNGGGGGNINIIANTSGAVIPGRDVVLFAGYNSIDQRGGDGAINGGGIAGITVQNFIAFDATDTDSNGLPGPGLAWVGGILNEIDIDERGGDGGTGSAGAGGFVFLLTDSTVNGVNVGDYYRGVVNRGALDGRTGNGAMPGFPNSFVLFDHFRTESRGSIDIRGGATTASGVGLNSISITSDDVVISTAPLLTDGDSSTAGNGGSDPAITISGKSVTVSGTLSARGGDAPTGIGGDGGVITITSSAGGSALSGTFTVRGGAGGTAGTDGAIIVDGVSLVLTNGALSF